MEIVNDDLRDLSGQPTIDLLSSEFTITSNSELAIETFNTPRSAIIGRTVSVPTPITNYSPHVSPSTVVRYELVDAEGSSTFLSDDESLPPISGRADASIHPNALHPIQPIAR
ncbi:MAG: hypothetical protein R3C99_19350 [Pirellulaceae bacterium]